MSRQAVTCTITFTVDADGAKLLPGWPGIWDCDKEPPRSGLYMEMQDAIHKSLATIEDHLPTVINARWVDVEINIGPEFSTHHPSQR